MGPNMIAAEECASGLLKNSMRKRAISAKSTENRKSFPGLKFNLLNRRITRKATRSNTL